MISVNNLIERPVTSRIVDSVGFVWIDNAPVNALSHRVRSGIIAEIQSLSQNNDASAIVIIGRGNTFPAGADIREFGKPIAEPQINSVNLAIEASRKPVIAAIHGSALGGGLEIAMACHFRIADSRARLGLPEVKLGLVPGAGGTQRLPRLIGSEAAMRAIVTSRIFTASEALELGLVDRVAPDNFEQQVIDFARQIISEKPPLQLARDSRAKLVSLEGGFIADFKSGLPSKLKNRVAVHQAIQCVQNASVLTFDEGLKGERESVAACKASPQSAALQHVFFAERAAFKIDGYAPGASTNRLAVIGLIGGGALQADIAVMALSAGIRVLIHEADPQKAPAILSSIQERLTKHRAKPPQDASAESGSARQLLKAVSTIAELKPADIVFVTGRENLEQKMATVSDLCEALDERTIIAAATAVLNVDVIAGACKAPHRFAGIHFFIPAHVMRQVEIVRAGGADQAAVSVLMEFCRRVGKVPAVIRDCDGFVGDSMLRAYLGTALEYLEAGFTATCVDAALRRFGMALGPFELCKFVGLDVAQMILNGRDDGAPAEARQRLLKLWEGRILEEGAPDPEGGEARTGVEQIAERCVRSAVLVGERLLREGIVLRKSDIDMVWINGLGFPEDKGGPMYWADSNAEPAP